MIDIDLRNRDGERPLNLAVKNRQTKIQIIKLLVTEDDDENLIYWDKFLPRSKYRNNAGTPVLHQAVMSNRLEVLKLLVSNFELDIKVTDRNNNTWLHVAATHQVDDSVMDYILSRPFNCKVDQRNNERKTALIIALYGSNEEHSFRLVKKLLPKTYEMPRRSPGRFYNPTDLLKPASIAIQQSLDRNGDPQKWCRYFMKISGYFCNRRNQKHQMLMFFMENYQPISQVESSDEWCNLHYYSIQLALHHAVWPNLDWLNKFDRYLICESDFLTFIMRKGINSDEHLRFALEACNQIDCDFTEFDLFEMLNDWFATDENRSVDHLERISKLLELFRSNGLEFDIMFSEKLNETWNPSTGPALRMLAPFCLELQMTSINSDYLTNEYLSEIAEATKGDESEDESDSLLPLIPSTTIATLKFLSRKAILRTHKDKLDDYLKNVARLELPQVLVDYLLFKLTRNDYMKIFN
jgi:Ankyrin repeats (3 copies)